MKRILGWTLFLLVGLFSCKEEDGPTSFQGVVVYADDNSPFLGGYIQFSGEESGFGSSTAEFREIRLDLNNGAFDLTFDANEDIIGFDIEVRDTVVFNIIRPEDGLDCGTIPCEEISPGKSYRDLIISVPR